MPPRLVVHDSGGEDEDDDSILALAGNETTALCGDLSALPSQPMAQAEASTDSTEPLARPIILNAAAPQTSHSATPRIVSGRSSIMAMALYQQGDAGIMTNDSLASSGKGHSDPASLTSQALRAELASAHAALLADIGTPSLLTSSSSSGLLMGQSIADSNSDAVRSLMVEPAPAASSGLEISYISTGDGISADIPSTTHLLSPPTAPTPDETSPAKGDSSTCRSGEKSRESGHNNEEHGKDIWEFDAFSQDPDVQGDDKNEKRRRDDTSYISDIHKGVDVTISDNGTEHARFTGQPNKDRTNGDRATKEKATPSAKRSKTSFDSYPVYNFTIAEPIILPDDDNDGDYIPNKSFCKAKKNPKSETSVSRRKKTRSNTDDWELMPALPKGRKATVLKQLAAGFEFGVDTKEAQKDNAAADPDRANSPARSIQDKVMVFPFKIDLTRDSVLLPKEEKEKYDVFSPSNTFPTTDSQPASPAEPNLPNLAVSENQSAFFDSIAVGTGADMSSTIPDEEYSRMTSREHAPDSQMRCPTTPPETPASPGKHKGLKRLGKRTRTLAQLLDSDGESENQLSNGEQFESSRIVRNTTQSATTKRARLKKPKDRSQPDAQDGKGLFEMANPQRIDIDPSGVEVQCTNSRSKNGKRVKIIDDSDDDSPLSDLETVMKDMGVEPTSEALSENTCLQRCKRKTASTQNSNEDIVERASQKPKSKRMSRKGSHQHKDDDPDERGEIESSQSDHGGKNNIVKERESNRKRKQQTTVAAVIAEQESCNERNDLDAGHKKATRLGRRSRKHRETIGTDADEDDTTTVDDSVFSTKELAASGTSVPNGKGPNASTENIPTATPAAVTEESKPLPVTPPSNNFRRKGPHSPINGGKPSAVKYRVGLSRRANIESLHSYLKR